MFGVALEMSLIKGEINLILTQPSTFIITNFIGLATFAITDTKCYVPVETLSTQDNAKVLQQLKFGFKIKNE